MHKINRTTFFSILMVLAYVLSACSGAPAVQPGNDQSSQSGQVQEVVFTGTVDSMGGGQWTVSGQAINIDGATSVDANIVVGDNVKVEARVGQDGSVTAIRIETSGADDTNANSNGDNQNDSNANDNTSNSNDNQADNSNSTNSNDDNSNGNGNDNSSDDDEQEVSGIVEAITTDSITIDGVVYMLADFTEFNDLIALGDQVKVHVIVNADGTFTIREIEKTTETGIGDDNSNSNGSDDNSNSNGNDDNSNDNGDDDNGNDDNSNDDDSNDNGDDDNGNDDDNSNSNGNG